MNKPPIDIPQTLGDRLRYSRIKKKLTQEDLGRLSNTNQAVIQKIENGKTHQPRKITEIAAALEVRPAWLMFGLGHEEELTEKAIKIARFYMQLKTNEAREQVFQTILDLIQKQNVR